MVGNITVYDFCSFRFIAIDIDKLRSFFKYPFKIIVMLFRGPVHSFAVHPSAKLALSCGKDKTLRTWNLMTARSAYITNVKQGK